MFKFWFWFWLLVGVHAFNRNSGIHTGIRGTGKKGVARINATLGWGVYPVGGSEAAGQDGEERKLRLLPALRRAIAGCIDASTIFFWYLLRRPSVGTAHGENSCCAEGARSGVDGGGRRRMMPSFALLPLRDVAPAIGAVC